ncbi:MAG: hypothetical protein AAF849_00750 [Bacteroidota bacterium]
MKRIIVLSILLLSCTSGGAQKEENLIKQFVKDLFDISLPEETLIQKYLVELKDKESFTISLQERIDKRLLYIKAIRNQMLEGEPSPSWLMPKKANANLENIVAKYSDYSYLNKFQFHEEKEKAIVENMYVLLDKDKREILQYFLIEEGKIKYFTLLVKSEQASFFGF